MLIDARYLGNVKLYWEDLIRELESSSRNNNQLKEIAVRLHRATKDLQDAVLKLPPQGRLVSLDMKVDIESRALFRRIARQ